MKTSGFTLIEILVAVAILALAVGLILPNFNFWRRQSVLDMGTQELVIALRLAQNKALASEGASPFGVYFENDRYTIFKGATYYPISPDNDVHVLSSSLRLSEFYLGGGQTLLFNQLTGGTDNFGSLKLSLAEDSTKNKTIYIDSSGVISLNSSLPVDTERVKDSRHVELYYNQDAQNANTLSLVFPADGVTENINYPAFLNAAQTEFSWEGTVIVSGAEQRIKLHTHSLTSGSALFCAHRDRRYNNKALDIYLDGQNLLRYSATGTTTRGASLWASEPILQ